MKIYIIGGRRDYKTSVYCDPIFVKTKKMTDFFSLLITQGRPKGILSAGSCLDANLRRVPGTSHFTLGCTVRGGIIPHFPDVAVTAWTLVYSEFRLLSYSSQLYYYIL